jgi:hypothetical protein
MTDEQKLKLELLQLTHNAGRSPEESIAYVNAYYDYLMTKSSASVVNPKPMGKTK